MSSTHFRKNARETDESVPILPFLPKNKNFTKSKVKLVRDGTNQVSCRLMRLKTIQIQLKPVQTIDLEFLIRTPRSVKSGLIIDESIRITESIPSRSMKIGLKADESV